MTRTWVSRRRCMNGWKDGGLFRSLSFWVRFWIKFVRLNDSISMSHSNKSTINSINMLLVGGGRRDWSRAWWVLAHFHQCHRSIHRNILFQNRTKSRGVTACWYRWSEYNFSNKLQRHVLGAPETHFNLLKCSIILDLLNLLLNVKSVSALGSSTTSVLSE